MNQAIGILGGTFSPIHYGHLKTAAEIFQRLDLAEIRLLPCHRPPHREAPGVSSKIRAEMVELACKEYPQFKVDLRELERDEPSYTVITLSQMQRQFPHTPLCFLIGMDSLLSFKSWHKWQEILTRCHLIVCCRPGWTLDKDADIQDLLKKYRTTNPELLSQTQAGLIYLAEVEQHNISSTDIRQRVVQGKDIKHLVPDEVADFIQAHGLYR